MAKKIIFQRNDSSNLPHSRSYLMRFECFLWTQWEMLFVTSLMINTKEKIRNLVWLISCDLMTQCFIQRRSKLVGFVVLLRFKYFFLVDRIQNKKVIDWTFYVGVSDKIQINSETSCLWKFRKLFKNYQKTVKYSTWKFCFYPWIKLWIMAARILK